MRPLVPSPRRARGMSIVELMVGVAISLFILAGATMVVTGQLGENRRLVTDTQIQQDLRTVADIITRDVRRAAYTGRSFQSIWPQTPVAGLIDAYATMTPDAAPAGTSQLQYSFTKANNPAAEDNALSDDEVSGFKFDDGTQAIYMQLGRGNWQPLTDPNSVRITRFDIIVNTEEQDVPCAAQCPVLGPTNCPLKYAMRNVVFVIVGQSATDATVTRSVNGAVRVRNDVVREACP
jgi:prepilin peptidase dependent protein B